MRFAIAGEGLTDYTVLKNLLIGFFKDKQLPVTRLVPRDKEPGGWGNLLNYVSSPYFREGCNNADYVIIQIDTKECSEWQAGINNIGDDHAQIEDFIKQCSGALIRKIGEEFYNVNIDKIHFAICVHEIECWLLPFNAQQPAHQKKMVGCANSIEQIAQKSGYSINQINYENGKHYDTLSKEMKNNKDLLQKGSLNPSLKVFLDRLTDSFQNKMATEN